jgi:hypothetical protein
MRRRFGISKVIGIICLVAIGTLVFSGIVMLLWNALLPGLFHFPVITIWQALGLLILCKILFGGFRPGGGPRGHWKDKMKQKWMNMTPEEKEKFKQDWGRRCRRPFDQGNRFDQGSPFEQGGPLSTENPSTERPSRDDR